MNLLRSLKKRARKNLITQHDKMRNFPARLVQQIAEAATKAGLKQVHIEWPPQGVFGQKHWLWYRVKGVYKEKTWLFEIQPGGKKSWVQEHMASSHNEKINWAWENGAEFMVIPAYGFNTQALTILIKEQLMRRNL